MLALIPCIGPVIALLLGIPLMMTPAATPVLGLIAAGLTPFEAVFLAALF